MDITLIVLCATALIALFLVYLLSRNLRRMDAQEMYEMSSRSYDAGYRNGYRDGAYHNEEKWSKRHSDMFGEHK